MKTAFPPETTHAMQEPAAPKSSPRRHRSFAAPRSSVPRGALIVVLLAAVLAALFGEHVLHGGLYTDDWAYAAIQHKDGTSGLFEALFASNRGRPVGEIYLSLTTAASGIDPRLHAMWGLLTLLFAASSLYLLLRLFALSVRDALIVVLLFMVFPFADSAWLWYADSYSYLAIGLAALGGALALTGLRRKGRVAAVYHAGAVVLFACSTLIYQVAAGLICLSILAYLRRTDRRRAVGLWAVDVCVVVLAVLLPGLIAGSAGTNADPIIPFGEQIEHAKLMLDQGATLLTYVLVPFGGPHRNVVLPIAFVIVCAGAGLAWRVGARSGLGRDLRRWLILLAVAGLVVAAAYAVYVPAPIHLYQPLGKGEENRVNVLASFGYAMAVYALAMVIATTALGLLRRPLGWAPLLGMSLVVAVFVGYVLRTRQDVAAWDRGGEIQRQEYRALRAAGRPAAGTTVYAFGGVGATAPGVYAFRVTWDLDGAIEILWNDFTLHGYPIFAGTKMVCSATGVVPVGPSNGDGIDQAAGYGHAVFYDLATGREQRIDDAAQCARAVAAFVPGPVEA